MTEGDYLNFMNEEFIYFHSKIHCVVKLNSEWALTHHNALNRGVGGRGGMFTATI